MALGVFSSSRHSSQDSIYPQLQYRSPWDDEPRPTRARVPQDTYRPTLTSQPRTAWSSYGADFGTSNHAAPVPPTGASGYARDLSRIKSDIVLAYVAFAAALTRTLSYLTWPVSALISALASKKTPRAQLSVWVNAAGIRPLERVQRQAAAALLAKSIGSARYYLGKSNRLYIPDCVDLAGYSKLTSLPDNLTVAGTLVLSSCRSLTHLPQGLVAQSGLDINGCVGLSELPAKLVICSGGLIMRDCPNIYTLPEDIILRGGIDASNCRNLTHLPDAVAQLHGYAYFTNCESLTYLPPGFSVGFATLQSRGDVGLQGCTSLSTLPDAFSCSGLLNLRDCRAMTTLPPSIMARGRDFPPQRRGIFLEGSGVPGSIFDAAEHFRVPETFRSWIQGTSNAFARPAREGTLANAVTFWQRLSAGVTAPRTHSWQLSRANGQLLRDFLRRLKETADYASLGARPYLARRVCALLTAMDQDVLFRTQALERITHALSSCSDRVILVMNELEVGMRVREAERGDMGGEALKDLLIRFMMLDIVHEDARKKIRSDRNDEHIEVYLAYETRLRETLNLPVNTQGMHHISCARVTQADFDATARKARRAASDRSKVEAYLATSSPWQHHLRRQAAAAFDWQALTPMDLPEGTQKDNLDCVITASRFDEIEEPIMFVKGNACVVYEASAFMRYWIEHGLEPTTRQKIDLGVMLRPKQS